MNDIESSLEEADGVGDQFMLAQFAEMNQDWRHYDQRIEAALNIYATAWAFLLAGVTALYSVARDLQVLFQFVSLPAAILCILGIFTVRRVINSTISRARRRAAINRAQDFFTRRAPHISPFLPVLASMPKPLKSVFVEPKHRGEKFEVSFPDGIVYFITALNVLLSGVVVTSICSWLFQAQNLWLLYILIVGAVLAERLFAYNEVKRAYPSKK